MDISATDIARGPPTRPAALVRGPGASLRSHLVRLLRRMAGRADPGDAEAYEDAVRTAFWTRAPEDRPEQVAPDYLADAARSSLPATRPARSVAWPTAARDERDAAAPTAAISAATGELGTDDGPAEERAADDRLPERTTKQAVPAADDLLRTPASVTPVADDFFAGLIRRVEGDR